VKIPKFLNGETFGYYKSCRKPGEFAHAMAAVLTGPNPRIVIGAMGGIPLLLEGDEAAPQMVASALRKHAAELDDVARHMQLIAVKRAFERLAA
jgi:carbon-monoxide dehydrogenase medium subunit